MTQVLADVTDDSAGSAAASLACAWQAAPMLALLDSLGLPANPQALPLLTGLLKLLAQRLPLPAEAAELQREGLARLADGSMRLTPRAQTLLEDCGLAIDDPARPDAEDQPHPVAQLHPIARLRIGQEQFEISQDPVKDGLAFRLSPQDPWHRLDVTLADGWAAIASEIIGATQDTLLEYVRMHMIHQRDEDGPDFASYSLYGIQWHLRHPASVLANACELRLDGGSWQPVALAEAVQQKTGRTLAAAALIAAMPGLADRIGADVRGWTLRIGAGAQVTPLM